MRCAVERKRSREKEREEEYIYENEKINEVMEGRGRAKRSTFACRTFNSSMFESERGTSLLAQHEQEGRRAA